MITLTCKECGNTQPFSGEQGLECEACGRRLDAMRDGTLLA